MSTSLNILEVRLTMILMIGLAVQQQALAAGSMNKGTMSVKPSWAATGGSARFSPTLSQSIKTAMPMGTSARTFTKFNKFQVNSNSKLVAKNNVSALNSVRFADRLANQKLHTLPGKSSDVVKKGPKFDPILIHKLDPGKSGGAPPLDPGKGNGPLPGGKSQCKLPCKWPCFPYPFGLYPFGYYPYGCYPYGGYPYFGCGINYYNRVSYVAPMTSATIDLALEDVRLVQAATPTTGPVYRVTFRNQGTAAAGAFRVAAFGSLDGQVSADNGTIADVAGLAAGESASVTLRLPMNVMRLTSSTAGQDGPFTRLAVAIDLDNAISESAKDNNVGMFDRASVDAR